MITKDIYNPGQEYIIIEGAHENNLKHVSLNIPKKQISIFTGVSGSGKSSLVLDTIAAKSRRELNETFPSFVQQYLPKYGRPHVDKIENLPVAIVIDQRKPGSNARSTVGTYTDIYSLLRLLFSRIGKPFVGYSDTFSFNHPQGRCTRCDGLGEIRELVCPDCGGTRLNQTVLSCRINGKNIAEVTGLAIPDIISWLNSIKEPIAYDIKQSIGGRLSALLEIGLGYLTLDRNMGTLSGGEAQRCKIAKYINSSLCDMLYILDEPSVGLHSHDIHLLKASVRKLRDHGNTVLLVEHHKEMIQIADHIIDMGPGSGMDGGNILYEGSYEGLLKSGTQTGKMIAEKVPLKQDLRKPSGWFMLEHASEHNLQDLTVKLPMGILTVIAGVAGSGKSSLMECFRKAYPEEVIYISQKNIGISLRSTPATYLGVADDIRKVFAQKSGAGSGMFSFNGKGGCPVCGGKGVIVSDMAFMDAIETVCEACGGLRYSPEALQYEVDGINIAEAMDLTVRKASLRFAGTIIEQKLLPLMQVGLGYLHLNQSLSTLSGGELQRVKLASHLDDRGKIYILDEPTDGLHVKDIRHIIELFDSMVDQGNTVFLVEHNLDVLKAADYVIELGPGGGQMGGKLIFTGTPQKMLSHPTSVTANYLKAELPDK